MSGSRLLLVSSDQTSNPLRVQLHKTLGQSAIFCSFYSIHKYLAPNIEGIVVVAITSSKDIEAAVRLIQEISLLQWPWKILVLELASPLPRQDLSFIDPYVKARLSWPDQAPQLSALTQVSRGQNGRIKRLEENSLSGQIASRALSHTPSLLPFAEPLAAAATHDVTVLLSGETGTGKSYLAQVIHESSPRKHHRFVVVSCGGLTANQLEMELFGYVKGAFAGSGRPRAGKLHAAGEGTVLLDEIEALGVEQQAKLVRVVETKKYEPLGSNRTQVCTARIIGTSNWNLEDAIERGKFHLGLYYRLNGMAFHLPPLRERVKDISPLARGIAVCFAHKFGKKVFTISPKVVSALEAFPWPGNIRQLEGVIQIALLSNSSPELLLKDLHKEVKYFRNPSNGFTHQSSSILESREKTERLAIEEALERWSQQELPCLGRPPRAT